MRREIGKSQGRAKWERKGTEKGRKEGRKEGRNEIGIAWKEEEETLPILTCHQRILIVAHLRRRYETTEVSTFQGDTECMVSTVCTSSVIPLIAIGAHLFFSSYANGSSVV